jgi:hypothetical protein
MPAQVTSTAGQARRRAGDCSLCRPPTMAALKTGVALCVVVDEILVIVVRLLLPVEACGRHPGMGAGPCAAASRNCPAPASGGDVYVALMRRVNPYPFKWVRS